MMLRDSAHSHAPCPSTCLWARHTYFLLSVSMTTTPGGGSDLPADMYPESATHRRQNQEYSSSSVSDIDLPPVAGCSWWPLRPPSQQVF